MIRLNFNVIIFVLFLNNVFSQKSEVPKNIKTILIKNSEYSGPFMDFNGFIELSFDDLDSDEKNYYYQINHFDYSWNSSNISKSEFLDGFDDLRIKKHRNSFNTLKSFTHYKLKIPNDEINFKISGNYSLSIHLSNGEKIFEKRFSIIKNEIPVQISISKSNIISNINTDQKISVNVNCANCSKIFNSSSKLKLVIIKNNNWMKSQIIEKPKYVFSDKLIYEDIYFKGGNEFFNFDNSNINSTNYRTYKSTLKEIYNNFLVTDKERTNSIYEYNPDINGDFIINSNKNYDLDIENDYARVYFNFKAEFYNSYRKVYLLGKFNDFMIDDNYELNFNSKTKSYNGSFLFKQGFYNYKYGFINSSTDNKIKNFEGDFWESENEYKVLLFIKKFNDRYFTIIGSNSLTSLNIKN
jgi:hypothetical protein